MSANSHTENPPTGNPPIGNSQLENPRTDSSNPGHTNPGHTDPGHSDPGHSDPGHSNTGSEPDPHGSSDVSQVRFLTVAEVARLMRVSKMTVYRLVHAGELPAARVGRSFRVAERDVHNYLESAYYSAG